MALTRRLGRTGRMVAPIGLGCWAIGGHFTLDGRNDGWGEVDDAQSIRAIEVGLDLGATLIDSADAYGTGHSEEIIGLAIKGRRDSVIIATKFGFTYDAGQRAVLGVDVSPSYIDRANAQSLKRLGIERIDLYQIHPGGLTEAEADAAGAALEKLAEAGRIGHWGWSTDDAGAARRMLKFPHFAAVQQELNVMHDGPDMLDLCAEAGLASLNRSPLAMGLLSGKFGPQTRFGAGDVRGAGHSWVKHFEGGVPTPQVLARLAALRDLLTSGGRTPAQGALGWILARSPHTFPIPGFKTEAQVRDNLGALEKGPLPAAVMAEIDAVLRTDLQLA
ncbi:aldo/keto reductase [Devosia sediminis]|uniref:Aldo/keto reductase n=1 Tax=Devosia sediminis TaxID=2798801 RepID=A0A934ISB9_9HYPH|nr:aldo/keto reductase [Devosia sediminis]MBJ3785888.1 aldo/keto reductase [Devosia sediminis]